MGRVQDELKHRTMTRWQWHALPLVAALLAVVYLFDPAQGGFPICPFRALTGLLCPGCGSQRALHALLHGKVGMAFGHNALLVASLPLLAVQGLWTKAFPGTRPPAARNAVVLAWLVLVVGWGIVRNL